MLASIIDSLTDCKYVQDATELQFSLCHYGRTAGERCVQSETSVGESPERFHEAVRQAR